MRKNKLIFIPIILVSLLFTGCNFNTIFKTRLTSIEISDNVNKYVIGDVFDEENSLTITAKYSDKSSKVISKGNTSFKAYLSYTSSEGKKINHDSSKPFEVAANYELVVKSGTISSNKLSITVITEHVYVESISISGPTEINAWERTNFTVSVTPSNYTTSLVYSASNPGYVTLTPNENGVEVYAQKSGEISIFVKSMRSKTEEISDSHQLNIISAARAVSMEQTYNDYIKHSPYNVSATPLNGDVKLLIIPTWLTDSNKYIKSSNHKNNVKEDIVKAYFGSSDEMGWYSVSEFYRIESQGRLNLTGTVSDWFECGASTATVGNPDYDTSGLVKRAVDWYFNNNPFDSRSNYDSDMDSVLDGVILIYAAPDYSTTSTLDDYKNLWAYCFWIQPKTTPSTIYPNVYFWASYDFMYGSTNVIAKTGSTYCSGDCTHTSVDAHTYIHEMGHMFGLDDYYDYTQTYSPAGGFSMQDYNIGGHDPFSLLSFGWVDTYIPDETVTITIRSFTDGHDLVLLSPQFNSYRSPFDEYLLVELYSPTGTNKLDSTYKYCGKYPTGSNKTGVRVWHVDARLCVGNSTGKLFTLSDSADVGQNRIRTAFTNTYYSDSVNSEYLSVLGSNYYDYNLLQLIRNNTSISHRYSETLTSSDLFYANDTFSMSKFSKQFIKETKLNNGKALGWSFVVDSIDIDLITKDATATITFTRG